MDAQIKAHLNGIRMQIETLEALGFFEPASEAPIGLAFMLRETKYEIGEAIAIERAKVMSG